MAVQEIPKRVFKQIVGSGNSGSITFFRDLVIGQFYILSVDAYSFDRGRDVDIYKIISSTQADVYKANKYNYQSVQTSPSPEQPSSPKNNSLYQSITIDGKAIGRVICNNRTIWQRQAQNANNKGWMQLWTGTLSLDDIRLPAYRTYLFKSDYDSFTRQASELIGMYQSINGNTLIARYDHSNNQLLVSGFGQNLVTVYGKN